jgi:hypothetical protein
MLASTRNEEEGRVSEVRSGGDFFWGRGALAPFFLEVGARAPRPQSIRPAQERSTLPLLILALLSITPIARAEVQIERGFLPDAGPSSFAIGLPGGVNFCFDPVRGGVSYAWTGDFLDLTPMRPGTGKFIKAAKPLGPIVYREAGPSPLRRGDPSRAPVVEFTGYTVGADVIEFRYTIDGAQVREEVRARPDGRGLIRRFKFDDGGDAKWWHVIDGKPATELKREAGGAFVLETLFSSEPK